MPWSFPSQQNLKRLEATLTLPDPGDFKDLDQSKKIDVDEGEGLQAMVTTMIHAGEKSSFYVQHRCVVEGPIH